MDHEVSVNKIAVQKTTDHQKSMKAGKTQTFGNKKVQAGNKNTHLNNSTSISLASY